MDINDRDALLIKTDSAVCQISAGTLNDGEFIKHNTEAAPPDGLDDSTRIEIALKSDDPEWIAYTLNVMGTVFPVDEEIMVKLEKRVLVLCWTVWPSATRRSRRRS